MNTIINALGRLCLFSILTIGQSMAGPSAQRVAFDVRIKAVDDSGAPVRDADVGFSWGLIGGTAPDTDFRRKQSDGTGVALFAGETVFRDYAYGAVKDGFYPNRAIHGEFLEKSGGRWQPSPLNLVILLKPIKRPTAMYAKEVSLIIPEVGKAVAFDFERGDWVSPLGHGVRKDVEFLVDGQYQTKDNYDGKLTIIFNGENAGVVSFDYDTSSHSELKMPYEAPENGYAPRWSWRNARVTGSEQGSTSTFDDDTKLQRGFFYRVRAIIDPEGRVVSAMYGKIHGPIYFRLFEGGKARVSFTYYLNPDLSRNLEFDPRRNLFPEERVVDP